MSSNLNETYKTKLTRANQPILQLLKEQQKVSVPFSEAQLTPSLSATLDAVTSYNQVAGRDRGRMLFGKLLDSNSSGLMVENNKPFSVDLNSETMSQVKAKASKGFGKLWQAEGDPNLNFDLSDSWRRDADLVAGEFIANAMFHAPREKVTFQIDILCNKKRLMELEANWALYEVYFVWFLDEYQGLGNVYRVLINLKNGNILAASSGRNIEIQPIEREIDIEIELVEPERAVSLDVEQEESFDEEYEHERG